MFIALSAFILVRVGQIGSKISLEACLQAGFSNWGPQRKPNEVFAMGRAEAPYLQIVPLGKEVARLFSGAV